MEDIEIRARVQALGDLLERYDLYMHQGGWLRAAGTAWRVVEAARVLLPWMRETSLQTSPEIGPKTP